MSKEYIFPWEDRWYKRNRWYWHIQHYMPSQVRSRRAHQRYLNGLNSAIPGLHFDRFGGGAPCQGYGQLDGKFVYYRLRSNIASLETWTDEKTFESMQCRNAIDSAVKYNVIPGQPFAGSPLDLDEQIALLAELIRMLRPHHPETNPTGQEEYGREVFHLLREHDARQ